MKNAIVTILCCAAIFEVCAQNQELRLQAIARNFMCENGDYSSGTKPEEIDMYGITVFVYDVTHDVFIEKDEKIPINDSLVIYRINNLNPHGIYYCMFVKDGRYEIINLKRPLYVILKQTLEYAKQIVFE